MIMGYAGDDVDLNISLVVKSLPATDHVQFAWIYSVAEPKFCLVL